MDNFIESLYAKFLLCDGVSIDTRTIRKNNLFFAISGPNFNANEFAQQALEKGASYAVIDDSAYATDDRFILVENGLKAMQHLAAFHRSKFKNPVIGITGSNGKTTTKELLTQVLSQKYQVHATKGNYNNHIGVPLTLLHLALETEVAIIEMGANHVGEIASYCKVAQPSHGLITNIGRAHTETFGGIEGIIRGKSELYDHLRKTKGTVFINMNDSVLSNMKKRFEDPQLYPAADFKLLGSSPFLRVELAGKPINTQTVGRYNFINMAAAASVGRYFDVPDELILKALGEYVADNARSQMIKKDSTTIILDAYNANPDSMKVALENLAEQAGSTWAILGDMNELEDSDVQHKEILDYARHLGIDRVLTVGDKIGKVADAETHFIDKKRLEEELKRTDLSETTVLLKASRSLKLETLVNSIS